MKNLEAYGGYNLSVHACERHIGKWHYILYGIAPSPFSYGVIVSEECYMLYENARRAAMNHIELLESEGFAQC